MEWQESKKREQRERADRWENTSGIHGYEERHYRAHGDTALAYTEIIATVRKLRVFRSFTRTPLVLDGAVATVVCATSEGVDAQEALQLNILS